MKYKLIKTLMLTCLSLAIVLPTDKKIESCNAIETNVDNTSINNVENNSVPTEVLEKTIIEKDVVEETKPEEKVAAPNKEVVETTKKPEVSSKEKTEKEVKEEVEQRQENSQEVQTTQSDKTNLGTFKLTAYCACSKCCGKWAGGNTASGTTPTQGRTVAVDTSVIPFGTKLVINGNTYVAEDTGSAIKGNKIDVFFNNHQEALNFGVQYAEVFVYNN